MNISSPSELRRFLDSLGVRAKKSLSQNFLIDGNIITNILAASGVQEGDVVIEIGPGPGALTQKLLQKGATVIAIEKDTTFAEALPRLATPGGAALHVINDDALEISYSDLIAAHCPPGTKARLIANLPYNITTPLLTKFLLLRDIFISCTVMVQREVAQRIVAAPRTKDYSSLSIFSRFYSDPTYSFTVRRSCFYPQPNVDSAIITAYIKEPPDIDEKAFFSVVRTAFQQRRKMMRSSLRELFAPTVIEAALTSCSLNPQARPEELSLEDFLAFTRKLFNK
jgi:16S rRNA (adenine1518-N6/adenine1519-N6)-dimethyltransferase